MYRDFVLILFFLNDVCQIANMPKLFVIVKRQHNELVNAYLWTFMNEIFHLLMYKFIYKLIHQR